MNLTPYASGSTEPWTVSVLQALVRLKRPKRILELGTFEGRTTEALAEVADGTKIITVEYDPLRFEALMFHPDMNVTAYRRDAIDFLETTQDLFDFVFVDDDHTYDHVLQEVNLLLDGIVAPGGFIVLHDVLGPFGLDKIVTDVGGFIINLPLLHAGGGLGVIEVPS